MLFLRRAVEEDLHLIFKWRNQKQVYEGFYTQTQPLSWQEHVEWWHSRNKDWREFIICLKEKTDIREIGVVTVGQLDHWSPEIGYFIGEISLWGKGYGTKAIRQVLSWLKNIGKEYVHTTALDKNERSLKLLKKLGFYCLGPARQGESWYQRRL